MDHLYKPRHTQATLTGSGPAPKATAPTNAKAKAKATSPSSSSSSKRNAVVTTDSVVKNAVGTTRQNAHRKGVPGPGSRGGATKLSARSKAVPMPQLTAADTKQAATRLEFYDRMAPKSLTASQAQDSAVLFDKAISSGKGLFADIPSERTSDFSALAKNKGAEDAWNNGQFSKLMPFSDLCRFPSIGVSEELKAHPRLSRAAAAARSAAAKKAKSGKKAAKSPAKGTSKYAARRSAPARGAATKWLTSADDYRTQIGFAAKYLTNETVIQTFPEDAQNEIRRLGLAYVKLLKNLNDANGDFQLAYAAALVDQATEAAQGGAVDPSNPQLLTGPNIQPTNLQPTDDEDPDDDEYDNDDGAVVQDNSQAFADIDDMVTSLADLDSPPLGGSARTTEDDADDLLSFYADHFRPSAEPPLAAKNADGLDLAEAKDMAVANKHREDFDDAENAEIDLDNTLASLQRSSTELDAMSKIEGDGRAVSTDDDLDALLAEIEAKNVVDARLAESKKRTDSISSFEDLRDELLDGLERFGQSSPAPAAQPVAPPPKMTAAEIKDTLDAYDFIENIQFPESPAASSTVRKKVDFAPNSDKKNSTKSHCERVEAKYPSWKKILGRAKRSS